MNYSIENIKLGDIRKGSPWMHEQLDDTFVITQKLFTSRVICLTNCSALKALRQIKVAIMNPMIKHFFINAYFCGMRNLPLYLKLQWYSGKITFVGQINKNFVE